MMHDTTAYGQFEQMEDYGDYGDEDYYDEYGQETRDFEGDGIEGLAKYQDGIMEDDLDENARQRRHGGRRRHGRRTAHRYPHKTH